MREHKISRRGFAGLVAGATAAVPALAQQVAPRSSGPPPVPAPFEAPIEFARRDEKAKVEPFAMEQVRLLPGVFQELAEWNRGYMSRLAVDRLVYNFRQNAGLPVGDAKPFGGWEMPADGKRGSELRGHFTGHFLSAMAQQYASANDASAKAKGEEMVAELAKCQQKLGGGYLSAFPIELFDRLDNLAGKPPVIDPATGRRDPKAPSLPWAPFYTVHKIMAGMFDMYRLAASKDALRVVEGMADWADQWSASKTEAHMQAILDTEFGGMAEVLYNLSAATGEEKWAKAGDRFQKKKFINPLALRRDELGGLHVNTHIPQVIAAARRYEITGDVRFHDVADFFWYEVTGARSYVTGGTSNGEGWHGSPRRLAAELKLSVDTAECCCAYNMLKLTRHLYGWTGDPRYFDYYERLMVNHRLGTMQPKTGYTQYYLSLTPGTWKTFGTEDQSFWCCTGSGVEEYSKLNDSIYWHDEEGVYVNLFLASELDWKAKGFKLRQETKFPEQQGTTLTVTAAAAGPLAVRLRIPGWLAASPTVKLNGRALEASATPGSYLTLKRVWKAGDKIELALPMRLSVEAMPDDRTMQAFLYGPVVLAGDLGNEGLTEARIVGPGGPQMSRVPPVAAPAFAAKGEVEAWIKPGATPFEFHTVGQKQDVTLLALHRIFDKRYSVYWQVA